MVPDDKYLFNNVKGQIVTSKAYIDMAVAGLINTNNDTANDYKLYNVLVDRTNALDSNISLITTNYSSMTDKSVFLASVSVVNVNATKTLVSTNNTDVQFISTKFTNNIVTGTDAMFDMNNSILDLEGVEFIGNTVEKSSMFKTVNTDVDISYSKLIENKLGTTLFEATNKSAMLSHTEIKKNEFAKDSVASLIKVTGANLLTQGKVVIDENISTNAATALVETDKDLVVIQNSTLDITNNSINRSNTDMQVLVKADNYNVNLNAKLNITGNQATCASTATSNTKY